MRVVEIAFAAYPVTDLKRARAFYEETLGLEVSHVFGDDSKAWVEYDIGPGTLAITNMVPEWEASPAGGTVGLEVDDFDESISRLQEHNVMFLQEPLESPVCRMAVIMDTEGNSITIHKRKAL